MLHNLVASSSVGHNLLEWIKIGALAIQSLTVVTISFAVRYSVGRDLVQATRRPATVGGYERLKISLGRALLLGLEILVAADIVRTVALEAILERFRGTGPGGAHLHLSRLCTGGRDRGALALAARSGGMGAWAASASHGARCGPTWRKLRSER